MSIIVSGPFISKSVSSILYSTCNIYFCCCIVLLYIFYGVHTWYLHMHHIRYRCKNFQRSVQKFWNNIKHFCFTCENYSNFGYKCKDENWKSTFVSSNTPLLPTILPFFSWIWAVYLLWPINDSLCAVLLQNQFCCDWCIFFCQTLS